MELIKWDEISNQIAICDDVKTLIKIDNRLDAIKTLVEQDDNSLGTLNKIAKYRIEVGRKIGSWSKELETMPGKRTDTTSSIGLTKLDNLKDVGLTKQTANKKEQISTVTDQELIKYYERAEKQKEQITQAGVEKIAKKRAIENKKDKILKKAVNYKDTPNIRLIEGDLFDVINQIDDKSIDLLNTDPPYFILNAKCSNLC